MKKKLEKKSKLAKKRAKDQKWKSYKEKGGIQIFPPGQHFVSLRHWLSVHISVEFIAFSKKAV